MNSIETRIVHEIGELSRVHAINFKAIIEARDEAIKERDAALQERDAARAEVVRLVAKLIHVYTAAHVTGDEARWEKK